MKRIGVFLMVALLLCLPCRAEQLLEQLGGQELARAGRTYDVGVELSAQMDMDRELDTLFGRLTQYLPQALKEAIRGGLLLLLVVLVCAMAGSMQAAGTAIQLPVTAMAGALAITGLCAGNMELMLGLGKETITKTQGFGQVLVPVMAACTAATGNVGTAAAKQVATLLFSNLLITIVDRWLVPLVYAYIAAYTAYAAVGNSGLKRVADFIKWVVTTVLTTLLILFVTYLTVSGAAAGSADAAALKATKTAISTAVPVVGGIVSNTAETILVGAGVVRSTVGVFGLLAILGICLTPFLRLGAHYLVYKISSAVASTMAEGRLAELIGAIGTAFGLIFGMTGTCTLLLLISVISGFGGI